MDDKTEAETLRRLLADRLIELERVRGWADARIASLEEPPLWLIAVSTALSSEEARYALSEAPGPLDELAVWSALARSWLDLLRADPERAGDVGKSLFDVGLAGTCPIDGLEDELTSFWDRIDLATDGTYGDLEVELERLASFLERWAGSSREG